MSVDVLEIIPELKIGIRKVLGLGKTIEDIQTAVDLTQREIQDVKKLISNVRLEAYQTIQIFIKRVASVGAIFDADKPTFTFENPFDKDMRLLSLILIPDANMKTLGAINIKIAGVDLMPITTFADFTDIGTLELPLPNNTGKLFRKQKKMTVHLWSSGATANLTLIWVLGQYYN